MIFNKLHDLFLKCNGVSIDTRSIKKDSLFFSLKGDNFDGNNYALEALKKGAKYAVVDNKNLSNPNFIKVENALASLQKLSSYHRSKLTSTKIIAITGSNGKTTTKELIHQVLKAKYKTSSTIGNLNNHVGVPLTLLKIKKSSDFAIVEMGANHIGEIKFLTNLIKPDIGYITNFGKAHLEGFGGYKGVIKGKSELYNWLLENNKPALINIEDKLQLEFLNAKGITFGKTKKAEFIFQIDQNDDFVTVNYKNFKINTNLIGSYNFSNVQAAISFGLYFKIDIILIKNAIENFKPKNNRSEFITRNNKKIILDAYNANPTSMKLAIDSFMKFSGSKILILGDMLELGRYSNNEHQRIIDLLEKINVKTYLIGNEFYNLKKQSIKILFFKTKKDLIFEISQNKVKEKNILIKGSRGMRMEDVLEKIQ